MDLFCYLCAWPFVTLKSANLLALLYVMFSYGFVTFSFGVLGQVWYLIASLPNLCLLPYFVYVNYIVVVFRFLLC